MKKILSIAVFLFAVTACGAALFAQEVQTPEQFLSVGHSSSISSVAFSPDGRRIATGSDDNTVKIWDAESGREIRTLAGHSSWINSVGFSPDGRRIVSGSGDKTIKIWNAETGQEIRTLAGHTREVNAAGFSPDGRRIVSGSGDKTIKIWNAETGQEIRTLAGHTHEVNATAYSPDGRRIASGSYDETIRIWDAETGRELRTVKAYDGNGTPNPVSFSPDGKRLASSDNRSNYFKIWDVETGRELRIVSASTSASIPIRSACFSPDGKRIACGLEDKTIKIFDVETGRELRSIAGHSAHILAVTYSPDGRRILSGSYDKTAKVWDAETGRELTQLPAIPAPLTRNMLVEYLSLAGNSARNTGPFSGQSLRRDSPRETALQFGAMVCKELVVTRFLGNSAAAAKWEAVLKTITDRGNATRAEIEAYYRQNIGAFIAAAVDAEFNKVSFLLDNSRTNPVRSHNAVLTRNQQNGQYMLSYEGAYTNGHQEITEFTLDALLAEMGRRKTDFDQTGINQVREKATLIPAVVIAEVGTTDAILGTTKNILTNFYLNPTTATCNNITALDITYRRSYERFVNDDFFELTRDAFTNTLYALDLALAQRVHADFRHGASLRSQELTAALNKVADRPRGGR